MAQKWFKYLFGESGDKTAVPDVTDPNGYVSYQSGYPIDYERVLGTDPLAKAIERQKLNQVLYDVTGGLQQYQMHGFPEFITAANNGGVAFAYGIDAIVRYDSGGGYNLYQNEVAGNTAIPTGAGWVKKDGLAGLNAPNFASPLSIDGVRVSPYYGKNYIINGGFDRWDYATSQTSSEYGSDNRWNNANSGSTKTHSQVASGDVERALFNSSKFSRTVVASVAGASNYVSKYQNIENVAKLAGKTVTISFWAKADTNKNMAIEIVQNFGTGGSPSATVSGIGSQLIALTSTWQKKTITITIPSIVGKTLGSDGVHTSYTSINPWFDAGSNLNARSASLGQQSGTFDIAEVKLEVGTVATPWTPYEGEFGGEVQACQRYYQRYGFGDYNIQYEGYALGGNATGITTIYPTMRIIPTVSIIGTWSVSNCAQPTVGGSFTNSIQIKALATVTGQVVFRTTPTSGITLSAEL